MKASLFTIALVVVCVGGCSSAYQGKYDLETQHLEQQRIREARDEAERQDARKYVAIVLFAVNSAEIDDAGFHELDWFLDKIRPYSNVYIEVRGYTDATGSEARNQPLSNKRAWIVQDYLISRGVSQDHVSASGFSDSNPARSNVNEKGRNQNRRAEVQVR